MHFKNIGVNLNHYEDGDRVSIARVKLAHGVWESKYYNFFNDVNQTVFTDLTWPVHYVKNNFNYSNSILAAIYRSKVFDKFRHLVIDPSSRMLEGASIQSNYWHLISFLKRDE